MKRQLADALTIFFLAVALVFASLDARADWCPAPEWDNWDKGLALSAAAAEITDWRQTQIIVKNPNRWHELNPVLGSHPSMAETNRYFLASSLLIGGISYCLPSTWRKAYLGTVTFVEVRMAQHNYSIGLRIGF